MTRSLLIHDSQKLHPELDFAAVRQVFTQSADKDLCGEMVTSPHDLFSVEALRDAHGVRTGKAFPADIFVFGKGESPRRDGTKVGGMPYWPANRPWPVDSKGTPYFFLGQFNFADSRDLFPDLPGDVLLLFVEDAELAPPDPIHFEWLPLGLAVGEFDKSLIAVKGGPFHGVIYRTADFPNDAQGGRNPFSRPTADWTDRLKVSQCWNLPILNGTKIGGIPHFIQNSDDCEAEFLCQLGSIQPAPRVAYPWVNHAEPLTLEHDDQGIHGERNHAVFADMGTIYVFRDRDGNVTSTFESY